MVGKNKKNRIEQPLGEDGEHMDGFCDERNNFGHNKKAHIDIPGGEVADKSGDRGEPGQYAGMPGPVSEDEIEFLFDDEEEPELDDGDLDEPGLDEPESILD